MVRYGPMGEQKNQTNAVSVMPMSSAHPIRHPHVKSSEIRTIEGTADATFTRSCNIAYNALLSSQMQEYGGMN